MKGTYFQYRMKPEQLCTMSEIATGSTINIRSSNKLNYPILEIDGYESVRYYFNK